MPIMPARHVGIDNPLVPKTDTQEAENLDKAISLIKKVQACAHSH
jgi:hypothetical protein